MPTYGKKAATIALISAFICYQFLIHKVIRSGQLTPISATLVFVPFIIATGWVISLDFGLLPALLITASMTTLGLVWVYVHGVPTIIFGLPHLVTNLFLLWFFARTLKDGREPLITSIARNVHGPMAPEIELYTRRVTYAWTLFFALQVAISIGLYAFASLDAWSMFINILNSPLIVLMFLAEYSYRILRYPDRRGSVFSGLGSFLQEKSASKLNKVR